MSVACAQWTVDIEKSEGIMRAHRCNGKMKSKWGKESREGLPGFRHCSRSENKKERKEERKKERGCVAWTLLGGLLAVAPGVWCMPSRRGPGSRSVF